MLLRTMLPDPSTLAMARWLVAFCVLLCAVSGQAQGVFVIEAEDFNYANGQTRAAASIMPYAGGAYVGLNNAVAGVDYNRPDDASSPEYRNDSRIPMNNNGGDLDRGGFPYPVTWTDERTFSIVVPLPRITNVLDVVGLSRTQTPVPGASDRITIINSGAIPRVEDFLVIGELNYNPAAASSSFVELHNANTASGFDLSGFRVQGIDYTFPEGSLIPANSYLVLARDRAAFATTYGNGIFVFGEFNGSLDNGGERVAVYRPEITAGVTNELLVTDVRYDNRLPWPPQADGLGPSLQLLDPARGSWRVGNWDAASTNDANRFTPGRVNSNRSFLDAFPALWLNELLINNQSGPTDNAGQREPFIELYNAGTNALQLESYYLSDTYTNLSRWQFPAGTTIAPGGWLVVVRGDWGFSVMPRHLRLEYLGAIYHVLNRADRRAAIFPDEANRHSIASRNDHEVEMDRGTSGDGELDECVLPPRH